MIRKLRWLALGPLLALLGAVPAAASTSFHSHLRRATGPVPTATHVRSTPSSDTSSAGLPDVRFGAIHLYPLRPDSSLGPVAPPVMVPGAVVNNLEYGNGAVQHQVRVYIDFWGWGGNTDGAQTYLDNFFSGLGGSTWLNSQTQYCSGSATTLGANCTTGYIQNPLGSLLAGTWSDSTTPIPAHPTDQDVANEAFRAMGHFGVYDPEAQVVVATAHAHSTAGFGTQYCAYHGDIVYASMSLSYTDLPFQPDAGPSCGMGDVNSPGTLDGFSIVEGHEFAESLTDPVVGQGWVKASGDETGDACAWISIGPGAAADITLPTGTFPVQSLWSNNDLAGTGGCVISYVSASQQS